MELIDVLTPAGEFTGERKSKSDVHRDGSWHRSVHVWIVTPDGKILLQRRSLRKENNPGLWDVSAAGHVSAGESAIDAAIRETGEELGLHVGASELVHIGRLVESSVLNGGTYIDNEIHEIFVVRRAVDLGGLRLQREEVDGVQLVWPHELTAYETVPHPGESAILRSAMAALPHSTEPAA